MRKKLILIDLDGVLNKYKGKFDKKYIPPINDGTLDFIKKLSIKYKIKIFTARNLLLTANWIFKNNLQNYIEDITNIKEPCYLIIDDRCICFDGDFTKLSNNIDNFVVYYFKNF